MTARVDAACPRCHAKRTLPGHLGRSTFRPEGLKFFSLSLSIPEVPVSDDACACVDCGLVWSELDAGRLRAKIVQVGGDDLKSRLGLSES